MRWLWQTLRPSLVLHLTLLFALSSAAVLFALGLLIAHSVAHHFSRQDRDMLNGKLELTRHIVEQTARQNAPPDVLVAQLNSALMGHHGLAVHVLGPQQTVVFKNQWLDFPSELLRSASPPPTAHTLRPMLDWVSLDGLPWRGSAERVAPLGPGGPSYTVLIATDTTHHAQFMQGFRGKLASFIGAATLLMAVLGWFVARGGLRPLRTISAQAAEITAHRLHTRLPAESVPEELADLAATLNLMLSRLEDSFQRLTEFSSDLAHELRSPVSNLLTQTQVTLARARSVEEYREILGSNIEEFERLSRMIADMLFLAKADNQQLVAHHEPVQLADEAADLLEFYAVLAEEKSIRLTLEGAAQVMGDRLMLRRAVGNLLSNALRHTPAQGWVRIHIHQPHPAWAHLEVSNSDSPIAPEHLPRLFDRFYRVDGSRQRTSEGSGLGLAITRSIVQAHGGSIDVQSNAQVTAFVLRLPVA